MIAHHQRHPPSFQTKPKNTNLDNSMRSSFVYSNSSSSCPSPIPPTVIRCFTHTSSFYKFADGISPNIGNQTIFQLTTLNCSKHDELQEESSTRLSYPDSFSTKIASTNNKNGLDRESTSTMSSIARDESTSRLLYLPKQRYVSMKLDFTPTSPLYNSTDCLASNYEKQTTVQPTTLKCFRDGEL